MRRIERQITDINIIKQFLDGGMYGVLSLVDKGNKPYAVPLCYGYDWKKNEKFPTFYMHSAREGRKLNIL